MSRKTRRRTHRLVAVLVCANVLVTGCAPQQPIFFGEDGDLSHYIDHATDISMPDVDTETLEEVAMARPPLTLENANFDEAWDLSLKDAVQYALTNSKVIRQLGGTFVGRGDPTAPNTGVTPSFLLDNPQSAVTIYRPALQETASPSIIRSSLAAGSGVEAALSEFDVQLSSQVFWEKNDRPQNFTGIIPGFPPVLQQDTGSFQATLSKAAATGTVFSASNSTSYDQNTPLGLRQFPSTWTTNFEFAVTQPFMQGAGTQYNRIAGPDNPFSGIGSTAIDGVMLARIDTDISVADFEKSVRDFVADVELAYWELYFGFRNLEARKVGLESALATWQRIYSLYRSGLQGGDAADEAQAREQYFLFRSQAEQAKSDLFTAESRLRYIMGLSISDGRLIRPADEPSSAKVSFDWNDVLGEALARSIELRRQKWQVKKRELEHIAAKNHLLPRFDGVALYRFHGYGDHLAGSTATGLAPQSALQTLTDGGFQEWELGLRFSMTLGFRAELAAVRHTELMLARDKAVLREQELELSHQLADAIRNLDANYITAQTNFNRRVAAAKQVDAIEAKFKAGTATLDLLLQAQRRRADSEAAYFRSLVDYNEAIAELHLRKGSLLEYNGVFLAEGPWPGKAYFDAKRLARQRDASIYLDYGFTRPAVVSRGPVDQRANDAAQGHDMIFPGNELPVDENMEVLPAPIEEFHGAQTNGAQTNGVRPAGVLAAGTVQPASYVEPTSGYPAQPATGQALFVGPVYESVADHSAR